MAPRYFSLVLVLIGLYSSLLWTTDHAQLVHQVHAMRSYYGLPLLPESALLSQLATDHSWAMARSGITYHSDLSRVPGPWYSVGENVAVASQPWYTIRLMMDSPTHREVLLGDWSEIGYGHIRANGRIYVTVLLVKR